MTVIAAFLFVFYVNYSQSDGSYVAIFDVDAGAFQFGPTIDGAVGVADEIFRRVVGDAAQGPGVDAVIGATARSVTSGG